VLPRFYVPDVHAKGQIVSLPSEEASHFARVLRGQPGDAIRVFDGRGLEFSAIVRESRRDDVTIEVQDRVAAAPEHRIAITLAQAVLKSDKMDDVIRDAVMMGVASIQPLVSARAETTVAAVERANRRERWRRIAVASAKQCGRAVVPDIAPVSTFEALADGLTLRNEPATALHFVEPGATDEAIGLAAVERPMAGAGVILLIGPEGGWTADEIERTARSCRRVTMHSATVRADAMAVVAMAALLATWGEL
jgi:16S rRNA (uracil1498-N3)-methyltransferase